HRPVRHGDEQTGRPEPVGAQSVARGGGLIPFASAGDEAHRRRGSVVHQALTLFVTSLCITSRAKRGSPITPSDFGGGDRRSILRLTSYVCSLIIRLNILPQNAR